MFLDKCPSNLTMNAACFIITNIPFSDYEESNSVDDKIRIPPIFLGCGISELACLRSDKNYKGLGDPPKTRL